MTRYLAVIAVLAASPCLAQETRTIVKGATDQSVYIRIVDAADGTPETGVTQATSGLDLEYVRNRAAAVDLTESDLAAVDSAHSDGGIKHIGNGVYRVDLPDAAVATGADAVLVTGTVTDMVVIPARIQLSGFDLQDATPAADVTQVLGTALNDGIAFGGVFEDTIAENISMFFGSTANFGSDSAAATTVSDIYVSAAAILDDTGTAGVLISDGTGAGQLNLASGVVDANVTQILGEAVDASPTPLDVNVVSTDAGAITATSFAAGAMDAAATAADFIAEVKTQVVDALTTDTYAEPTGVPAATDDLATKISYLYNFLLRNRIDVTASKKTFYDDGGAAEFEKDLTDDGTTYSETEVNAP